MANQVEDIRKIALFSVQKPSDEAWLRSIYRWYSKTFHTPLHEVEDLPKDFVLLNYFETIFEEMDAEDIKAEIEYSLESPEERKAKKNKEQAEEDEFMAMIAEEAAKEREQKKLEDIKVPKGKSLKEVAEEPAPVMHPDVEKPHPSYVPEEDIKVSFSDDIEFNELLDADFSVNKK